MPIVIISYISQGDSTEQPIGNNDSEDIHKHLQFIQHIRADAASASKGADLKMVKKSLSENPPATYSLGEEVMVRRLNASTLKRKASKDKLMRFVQGTVKDFSEKTLCYKISYVLEGKPKEGWFKVSDITSLTYNEECARHHLLIDGITVDYYKAHNIMYRVTRTH